MNPYGQSLGGGNGLNLGLVSVNPLLSVQVTKNDDGEKVVKPWVNLHVTPNAGLVHKVGDIVHKLKSPHYYGGGYGHEYPPPSYHHQHNHYHVPSSPPIPSYYGGGPSYYPSKPFYHSKPPPPSYYGAGYGGGYSNGASYAPEYPSYREDEYDDITGGGGYGESGDAGYYGDQQNDYESPYYGRSANVTGGDGTGNGNDYGQSSSGAGSPKVAFPNDRQSTGSVKFVGGQRRKRDVIDEVRRFNMCGSRVTLSLDIIL